MPPLSAIGALNVFDLRRVQAGHGIVTTPEQAVTAPKFLAFTSENYSLNHPRTNDSEGIIAGTSPLARKLDVIG